LGTFFTVAMYAAPQSQALVAHQGYFSPPPGDEMTFPHAALKLSAAGLVAAAALFTAASANAGTSWSIGVNLPGVLVNEPAPGYYDEPAPVYSRPAPSYYQPAQPVYSVPAPIYYEPGSRWEERRAQRWEERRAERREWRRRQWERERYRRYYQDRD
jgi:hypothetical protein